MLRRVHLQSPRACMSNIQTQVYVHVFLSLFLPHKVHNFAAAVQPGGSCGARLSSASRYNSLWVYRWPRHLQCGKYALCAAANHHGADAQRTHAPTGEWEHFHSEAMKRAVSEPENEEFLMMLKAHLSLVVLSTYVCKTESFTLFHPQTMHTEYVHCFCSVIWTPCVSVVCFCQSLAQQALMGTINSSMQAVQQAQADLIYADNPPPLGHDLVSLLSTYDTV